MMKAVKVWALLLVTISPVEAAFEASARLRADPCGAKVIQAAHARWGKNAKGRIGFLAELGDLFPPNTPDEVYDLLNDNFFELSNRPYMPSLVRRTLSLIPETTADEPRMLLCIADRALEPGALFRESDVTFSPSSVYGPVNMCAMPQFRARKPLQAQVEPWFDKLIIHAAEFAAYERMVAFLTTMQRTSREASDSVTDRFFSSVTEEANGRRRFRPAFSTIYSKGIRAYVQEYLKGLHQRVPWSRNSPPLEAIFGADPAAESELKRLGMTQANFFSRLEALDSLLAEAEDPSLGLEAPSDLPSFPFPPSNVHAVFEDFFNRRTGGLANYEAVSGSATAVHRLDELSNLAGKLRSRSGALRLGTDSFGVSFLSDIPFVTVSRETSPLDAALFEAELWLYDQLRPLAPSSTEARLASFNPLFRVNMADKAMRLFLGGRYPNYLTNLRLQNREKGLTALQTKELLRMVTLSEREMIAWGYRGAVHAAILLKNPSQFDPRQDPHPRALQTHFTRFLVESILRYDEKAHSVVARASRQQYALALVARLSGDVALAEIHEAEAKAIEGIDLMDWEGVHERAPFPGKQRLTSYVERTLKQAHKGGVILGDSLFPPEDL